MVLAVGTALANTDSTGPALSPRAAAAKIAAARVPFIENKGQISAEEVQFYAKTFAGTLFVTRQNVLVYSLPLKSQKNPRASWVFRESFVGRRPTRPYGERKSPVRVSAYKGTDPHSWRHQLAAFDSIGLGELYPQSRRQQCGETNFHLAGRCAGCD